MTECSVAIIATIITSSIFLMFIVISIVAVIEEKNFRKKEEYLKSIGFKNHGAYGPFGFGLNWTYMRAPKECITADELNKITLRKLKKIYPERSLQDGYKEKT